MKVNYIKLKFDGAFIEILQPSKEEVDAIQMGMKSGGIQTLDLKEAEYTVNFDKVNYIKIDRVKDE